MGETICVEVKTNETETAEMLEKVLNDDKTAANLLAAEVHKEIDIETINTAKLPDNCDLNINLNDLGIWIDPIGLIHKINH